MKLSKWAIKQGISYTTAWRWFKAGKIPGASKTVSGTILVQEEPNLTNAEIKLKLILEILNG